MADKQTPEISIRHAILHILDFTTQLNVLSQEELDLSRDTLYGYVFRQIWGTLDDPRIHYAEFAPEAELMRALLDYRRGSTGFIDLTDAAADRFIRRFEEHPDLQAFDLLIVDYTYEMRPCIAILVLENIRAWTHNVDNSTGILRNDIVEHHAVLPSPTRKAKSYALIDLSNMRIRFVDEMKTSADKEPGILRSVLECSETRSTKEAVKLLERITAAVAEEHEENPFVAVSKVRNFMKSHGETFSSFSVDDLEEEIFADSPKMREAFRERIGDAALPERVEMPEPALKQVSRKQKIRTDTGIELLIPAEYMGDPEYVEFHSYPDGSLTIELKQIGRIINKSG